MPRSARPGRRRRLRHPVRSSSLRTAGTGPIPITAGSTPATAEPKNVPSGSTPRSRARSSLAITSAAAPSLIPLASPAGPSRLRNAGRRPASFSTEVSGRGCSSCPSSPPGTSSSAKRPASLRGRPALLRAKRERILVVPRHVPALGNVLPRLAHRLARVPLLVARVREPPAERCVVDRPIAPGVGRVGLPHHQRRARHRLDPARDEEVTVPGDHGVTRADDRREPRTRRACSP